MAKNEPLLIDQGSVLQMTVAAFLDGAPASLVGWTGKMQIRKKKASNEVLAEYSSTGGHITFADGQVLVDVLGSDTMLLTETSAVYDLYIYEPDGKPHRILEGNVLISLTVTR